MTCFWLDTIQADMTKKRDLKRLNNFPNLQFQQELLKLLFQLGPLAQLSAGPSLRVRDG
jgi:hypothetical protein